MKERSILASGPMVRAILEGRKTQTRRVVKPQPVREGTGWFWESKRLDAGYLHTDEEAMCRLMCDISPFGVPGDRLWVRESLRLDLDRGWQYADTSPMQIPAESYDEAEAWMSNKRGGYCPSIHMPRWASRITLEVTGVRVERVQDIGRDGRKAKDVLAEGVDPEAIERNRAWFHPDDCPALAFGGLWDSINGKTYPWKSNPWVWVVEFKRI